MRRIRLSNLFHSVGAAKLKDLSKNVLEQFLLSGGITNNKSSLAERVFVELLFFFTNSDKYMGAVWSTKALADYSFNTGMLIIVSAHICILYFEPNRISISISNLFNNLV